MERAHCEKTGWSGAEDLLDLLGHLAIALIDEARQEGVGVDRSAFSFGAQRLLQRARVCVGPRVGQRLETRLEALVVELGERLFEKRLLLLRRQSIEDRELIGEGLEPAYLLVRRGGVTQKI